MTQGVLFQKHDFDCWVGDSKSRRVHVVLAPCIPFFACRETVWSYDRERNVRPGMFAVHTTCHHCRRFAKRFNWMHSTVVGLLETWQHFLIAADWFDEAGDKRRANALRFAAEAHETIPRHLTRLKAWNYLRGVA